MERWGGGGAIRWGLPMEVLGGNPRGREEFLVEVEGG